MGILIAAWQRCNTPPPRSNTLVVAIKTTHYRFLTTGLMRICKTKVLVRAT
jgi:hypothetical protein